MRILIRIVFVIFIAKGIDCLGGVCDNCCECLKEKEKNKKEEIKKDENIAAKSLVNNKWYRTKKNKPVLMIFKKEENNDIFTSTENEAIKLDENDNSKIAYQDEAEDKLNLKDQKYALFEIKTQEGENTVYLYCSDVESSEVKIHEHINNFYGIFGETDHVSISIIACDTKKVTNMASMFYNCRNLKDLKFGESFNTTKVTNMDDMFFNCSSLTELNLKNFNTENVTGMVYMFLNCSNLENLNLNNFNTEKVTDMEGMFYECSSLKKLEFGENFKTEKVTNKSGMFSRCDNFPDDIRNKLDNVEEIIKFFKEKTTKKDFLKYHSAIK